MADLNSDRALIVEDGIVVNVAVADADTARENGWIMSSSGNIGDHYDADSDTVVSSDNELDGGDDATAMTRQEAINWIDATADRIRAADRSVGQYLDAEYQIVAEALVAYRADPTGEVPDAVQSYADAEGLSVKDAAEQIAEAAARAEDLLQAVRRIRLAGKAAIRDAVDDADMMEVARPYIDQLEALAEPQSVDS